MKKLIVLVAVIGATALPVVASAQTEEPPPGVARVGHAEGLTQFKWQGANGVGANTTPFVADDIACADTPDTLCDVSLVEFSYPMTQAEIAEGRTSHTKAGTISIRNGGPLTDPPTDLDLQVLESDESGTQGPEVGVSGALDTDWASESVPVTVRTTEAQPSKWFLVRVIYFASAGNSYFGQAGFDLPAGVDQGASLALGETFSWDGSSAAAHNLNYFGLLDAGPPPNSPPTLPDPVPPYPEQVPDELPAPPVWSQDVSGESNSCSKDSNTYCEQVLIEYNNPLTPEEIEAGLASRKKRSTIRIDWDNDVPDFDLEVYQSDSKGAVGDMIGSSTEFNTTFEAIDHTVTTTATQPTVHVVVRVIYWLAPGTEYAGTVTF